MVFVGVTHSWGDVLSGDPPMLALPATRTVEVHVIASDAEGAVVASLQRKEADAEGSCGVDGRYDGRRVARPCAGSVKNPRRDAPTARRDPVMDEVRAGGTVMDVLNQK